MDKTVLTYGTFDLFHIGHLRMLQRLKSLGNRLIVGVSTDEFNAEKGKQSVYSFAERAEIVAALDCVDEVIPESNWKQKMSDVEKFNVSIFGIGEDWRGKFDELEEKCEVVYLPRTPSISTTEIRRSLSKINAEKLEEIKQGLDGLLNIVKAIE